MYRKSFYVLSVLVARHMPHKFRDRCIYRRETLPSNLRLGTVVRVFAVANATDVAAVFDIGKSTVYKIVKVVVNAISVQGVCDSNYRFLYISGLCGVPHTIH